MLKSLMSKKARWLIPIYTVFYVAAFMFLIAVQAMENPQFPGYLTVTGNLPGCDDDSPIYLVAGDTAYEASPVGSGGSQAGNYPFTAYLPAGTDLTGAVALYRTGGESVFCALGQAG